MPQTTIDKLIVNSPYEEPARHWSYNRENRLFNLEDGRREAGYVIASPQSKAFDDPGIFVPIEPANKMPSTGEAVARKRISGYNRHHQTSA